MTSPHSDDHVRPLVSVLMAVYNGEKYLSAAIESILQQTFSDFEFLIHDDGSRDTSLQIAQRYACQDVRIRVTYGENQGLAASLNMLIEMSQGIYLARIDADDIAFSDRFAKQVAYLEAHPDCAVLGSAMRMCDDRLRPILSLVVAEDHSEIDANNLRGVTSIMHPTVMMRKEKCVQAGAYDPSFMASQDLDLWLRMAEVGRLHNLQDILLKYRLHDESVSGSKADLQRDMCRRACEAAWERRGVTSAFDYSDWRPGETRASRLEFYLRYGWQAWNEGFRETWRHYALKSIRTAPFSRAAWTLLVAGGLKRGGNRAGQTP
ncbi:MAG: glycosyltransferase [Pseudomonadota bacterium]